MSDSEQILKEEIDGILNDIRQKYEESGKKVSGQFIEGLEAVYESSAFQMKGTVQGYTYLAGRRPGKMPPVSAILEWVKNKGIFQFEKEYQARGIAYVIARKIAQEGTSKKYLLRIYEEVITPERIDRIISRVSELNVNKIINQVRAELEVLEKNV